MSRENFDEIMNLQRQLASRVVQENELELQMKLLEIVHSLVTDRSKVVTTAAILTEAGFQGITEDQAARILKTLEDLGQIRRAPGGYRRT